MIVDKIEAFLRGEIVPTQAQTDRALAFIGARWNAEAFRRNFLSSDEERDAGRQPVTGSSPHYCSRSIYYAMTGAPKEKAPPRAWVKFSLGNHTEDLVVALAILAGVDVVWPDDQGRQYNGTATVAGEGIPVHPDMVIYYPGVGHVPVEIKTMAAGRAPTRNFGGYGFAKFAATREVDNTFGHLDQVHKEMACINAPRGFYVGCETSELVGRMAEVEVPWDPAVWDAIETSHRTARQSQVIGGPPARPAWAVTDKFTADGARYVKDVRCSYCKVRAPCWGDPRMVVGDKGKPVWVITKEVM